MTGKRAKPWTERRAVRDVIRSFEWYEPPTVIRERGESIWQNHATLMRYRAAQPRHEADRLIRTLGDTVRIEGQVRGNYRGEGAKRYATSPGLMTLTDVDLTLFENGARA